MEISDHDRSILKHDLQNPLPWYPKAALTCLFFANSASLPFPSQAVEAVIAPRKNGERAKKWEMQSRRKAASWQLETFAWRFRNFGKKDYLRGRRGKPIKIDRTQVDDQRCRMQRLEKHIGRERERGLADSASLI